MAQLTVTFYNAQNSIYPRIAQAIKKHLTISDERKPHWATTVCFEQARNQLPDKATPYICPTIKGFDWMSSGHCANDLGLIEIEQDKDPIDQVFDFRGLRYGRPVDPGSTMSYRIEFFGKSINNVGDYPFIIRITDDFVGNQDEISLLNSWGNRLKEVGRDQMVNEMIDVGSAAHGAIPSMDSMFAGLPKTGDGFEQRLETTLKRLTLNMIDWSIGAERFFFDFIGKPVETVAGKPDSIEAIGPYDFKLSLSPKDLEIINGFPTLTVEQVLEMIFPKADDDFIMARTKVSI